MPRLAVPIRAKVSAPSVASQKGFAPRRRPQQSRSQLTVNVIFEATMQVLLAVGIHRLTTTRVAERAGVSVGTLYQYYPNKHALLQGILERHLDRVVVAVENAARRASHRPLEDMVMGVIGAFVRAKTENVEESRALYRVVNELGSTDVVTAASERGVAAVAQMLATAADAAFEHLDLTASVFVAAMVGTARAVLEGDAPPQLLRELRKQLVSLCLGYLQREMR